MNLDIPVTCQEIGYRANIYIGGKPISEQLEIIRDHQTKAVIGYRTTNGLTFTQIDNAVQEQISFSANHTPLDNFYVLWRKLNDTPLFSTGFPDHIQYLHGLADKTPRQPDKIQILYDHHNKKIIVTNLSHRTCLIADDAHSTVLLIPVGQQAELDL